MRPATAYPLWPNGCLQQIAANRFSTPQDVIAILLQGFVRASLFASTREPLREEPHVVRNGYYHPARRRPPRRNRPEAHRHISSSQGLERLTPTTPLGAAILPNRKRIRRPTASTTEIASAGLDLATPLKPEPCTPTTSQDFRALIVAPATRLTLTHPEVEAQPMPLGFVPSRRA
jgi:hypothetical protein